MAFRAFIIGATTYGLKYSYDEAQAFANKLEDFGYLVIAAQPQINQTLLNAKLNVFYDSIQHTDTVIVYFSGHANWVKGKLQLILNNDGGRESVFRAHDILEELANIVCKQKIIILDCCHANASVNDWNIPFDDTYVILTASKRLEKSKELERLNGSFLTQTILNILNHTDHWQRDDGLYLNNLYEEIKINARNNNSQYSDEQVPMPNLLGHLDNIKFAEINLENQSSSRWEQEYTDLLLKKCDIIDLANLPLDNQYLATRSLALRSLYVPLRFWVHHNDINKSVQIAKIESMKLKNFQLQSNFSLDQASQKRLDYINSLRVKLQHKKYQKISNQDTYQKTRLGIGDCLAISKKIIVLGDPGAGKSTLLRWLATAGLLYKKQPEAWRKLPDIDTLPQVNYLPILIRCREIQLTDCYSLQNLLQGMINKLLASSDHQRNNHILRILENAIHTGQAMLLIDGLDELGLELRSILCETLANCAEEYPNTVMIVTSRIVGFSEVGRNLINFNQITIANLIAEEKDLFAERWYAMVEPFEPQLMARELIEQIHSHNRIEQLTSSPMLLTTMALVKRKIGRLPDRRGELYSEALKVLFSWRNLVDKPLNLYEVMPQLQYLAYSMCQEGVQQLREDQIILYWSNLRRDYPYLCEVTQHTPSEFLKLVVQRTGILFEAGEQRFNGRYIPVYEFRHLTFQEYLAALAIIDGRYPNYNPQQSLADLVCTISQELTDIGGVLQPLIVEHWREPLRLVITCCNDQELHRILPLLIILDEQTNPLIYQARLTLICECLRDNLNINTSLVNTIIYQAVNQISDNKFNFLQQAITNLSESRWINITRKILIDIFIDNPSIEIGESIGNLSITNKKLDSSWYEERYKMLEGSQSDFIQAFWELKKHYLKKLHPDIDRILLSIFSTSYSASIVMSILHFYSSINIDINNLFSQFSIDKIFSFAFYNPTHNHIISESLNILIKIGDSKLLPYEYIIQNLNHENERIRLLTITALGKINDDRAINDLIHLLDDPSIEIRRNTISVLGKLKNNHAVPSLIKCLKDKNPTIRQEASIALRLLNDQRAIAPLIAQLTDPAVYVRMNIIEALGALGNIDAVEPLINNLNTDVIYIRLNIIKVLSILGDSRSVIPLINYLADKNDSVRMNVATALGILGDIQAIDALITSLDDPIPAVRKEIIGALGRLGHPRSIMPLLQCIHDPVAYVRLETIKALSAFGYQDFTEHLIVALKDENEFVRREAATILGGLNNQQSITPLLDCLKDQSAFVRMKVATALGQLKNLSAVEPLICCLNDENPSVRLNVIIALGQLNDQRAIEPLTRCLNDENTSIQANAILVIKTLTTNQQ